MTTTPRGLLIFAEEFMRAAEAVEKLCPEDRLPRYYLFGHTLELALKAFLLAEGVSLDDLKRKFGHDLLRLAKEANSLGLDRAETISSIDFAVIRIINIDYLTKRFEYGEHGTTYHVPERQYLIKTVRKLIRGIGRYLQQTHGL